ncbi:MAG: helicase-exonuclease AddAB subunit AddB, partial [Lachnospiraceae bacterium]|nr:helicase-exonuclease AddAB subunit AddB [Lachnospiraceae bacterium]
MSVLMVTGVDLEEKTTSLLQYTIRRAVEEPDKDFLWFAPEQMTMDIERRLIRLHPRHALSNIRVYGLHRFARQRIMSRVQGQPQILDEIDKILLLENIVLEKQEELGLLKHKLLRNIGYVNEVKSVISEFQQYCVQP